VQGDGAGAELVRVIRKIAQVEKRLKAIAEESEEHRTGAVFKLKTQADQAKRNGRDLIKDLSEHVDRQIIEARGELNRASDKASP
jgi:hypothetical protein